MNKDEDVEAIERVYDLWREPWQAGDASGVASFYAENAIQVPVDEPDIIGREAWTENLTSIFSEFTVRESSSEILEVETSGDMAFARGTYDIILLPKEGGDLSHFRGKFIHIFRRQSDGSWKIYRALGADEPPA